MKFKGYQGENTAVLDTMFTQAVDGGEVRGGLDCLFFPQLLETQCLAYDQIQRAFLRQEAVNARLCCGRTNFDQFYLVTEVEGQPQRQSRLSDLEVGRKILALIEEKNPKTEIGFYKK